MIRLQPRSTRPDPPFPVTTPLRADAGTALAAARARLAPPALLLAWRSRGALVSRIRCGGVSGRCGGCLACDRLCQLEGSCPKLLAMDTAPYLQRRRPKPLPNCATCHLIVTKRVGCLHAGPAYSVPATLLACAQIGRAHV